MIRDIITVHDMELLQILKGHTGRIWYVNWNLEGNILASCGEDKTIRLWFKENQDKLTLGLKTILTDGHQRTIRSVSWSPCRNYLASASFDGTVAIWDKKSGEFECNITLEGHENEVKSVAWSSSGNFLATCSRDKTVWIWQVTDEEYECFAVLNTHSQDVKKVIWHPHDNILASASYDNTINIYKVDDSDDEWTCCGTLKSHESTVWSISFNSTGKRLASCSDDCTVKIWQEFNSTNKYGIVKSENECTWKCICTISGYHSRTIYDVSWCHLSNLIATACADDAIRIFKEVDSLSEEEIEFRLVAMCNNAHSQDVNCVHWNPCIPGILASCSDDSEIKIWCIQEDKLE